MSDLNESNENLETPQIEIKSETLEMNFEIEKIKKEEENEKEQEKATNNIQEDMNIEVTKNETDNIKNNQDNEIVVAKDNELETGKEVDTKSFDLNDQNELDYEDEFDESTTNVSKPPKETNSVNTKKNPTKQDDDENDEDDDEESEGEVKSTKNSDVESDLDEGEVPSPKAASRKEPIKLKEIEETKRDAEDEQIEKQEEEDGEINDGEKVKKAFIPRVLCKYYQRGKCTWGRTCKFLHPGVNDTGNYSFLEFQDPNAKLFQQQQVGSNLPQQDSTKLSSTQVSNSHSIAGDPNEPLQTESAWERGLRHAKEMKEKALRRKQMEKDEFNDKKMNLSLKDFENEKENDERYVNIEKMPTADDDLEDEELNLFAKTGRINSEKQRSTNQFSKTTQDDRSFQSQNTFTNKSAGFNQNKPQNRSFDSKNESESTQRPEFKSDSKSNKASGRRSSPSPTNRALNQNRQKADEWHDPWDRSRQNKKNQGKEPRKDRSNSYSSSDSDSRSRSRSKSRSRSISRSSYSSKSSYANRSSSRSYSRSRSGSRSSNKAAKGQRKNPNIDRQSRPLQRAGNLDGAKQSLNKNVQSVKPAIDQTTTKTKQIEQKNLTKPLPGRQISDFSLKKASLESEKSKKAKTSSRSPSNSSTSSYDSSKSEDEDDDEEDFSNDGSDSYSDEDDLSDSKKKIKKTIKKSISLKPETKNSLKRPAQESKTNADLKRTKLSTTGSTAPASGTATDKKQMIKDQLKLLESALKKKTMAK